MDNISIQKILELNKQFYRSISSEFDTTRQYPWKGWKEIYNILPKDKKISVLDVGCGNCRLYKFLLDVIPSEHFSYFGIDNNSDLLQKASSNYGEYTNFSISNKDIFSELSLPKFDYIFCFGVTHHIPDNAFRLSWFDKVSKLCNEYFVFTNWNLNKDTRSSRLLKSLPGIDNLEPGDYFYTWQNKEIYRYVHFYTDQEMKCVLKILNTNGLILENSYKSDGKSNNLNTYYIFKNKGSQ